MNQGGFDCLPVRVSPSAEPVRAPSGNGFGNGRGNAPVTQA